MSDTRSALEKYFESLDGYKMPGFEIEGVYRCDYCSGFINPTKRGHESPERRITHYLCDTLLNEEYTPSSPAPFDILRTYCPDCDRQKIQWPCKGFNELLVSSNFRPDGTLDTFKVEDHSGSDHGEPWSPPEVWEGVHGILDHGATFEDWMKFNMMRDSIDREDQGSPRHPIGFGPEDIVDSLQAYQIDIREVTNEEGEVDIDEQKEKELRKHLEKRMEELGGSIGDEKHWHETVTRSR